MAVTKTDQFNVWPLPGQLDDWLTDGQGIHTVFARDLVTQLNNIGSYCNPWAQYMQSCTPFQSKDGITGTTVFAAGEYLTFQCPVVVPAGAVRMLWTAGVTFAAGVGSIDSARVYMSSSAYTKTPQGPGTYSSGIAYDGKFDQTGVFPQRRTIGVYSPAVSSASKAVNLSAAGYRFVTDTDVDLVTGKGGVMNLDSACVTVSSGTGKTRISNLIFTLTCSTSSAISLAVADFTCWFSYE